jgi:glycogen operon protein
MELCLFDDEGRQRIEWMTPEQGCWVADVANAAPGQQYGYRAHGPWEPARRRWFNPAKLLLDPYARAVTGDYRAEDRTVAHRPGATDHRDDRDSAAAVPRSVVVAPPPAAAPGPRTPWSDTVVYELHVKGFTARHPGVPEPLRGSYAGLAHPAAIEHLVGLGVTAVELMPVQQFVSEPALQRRGMANYWGYNPVAWFAPHAAYSASGSLGGQVAEFAAMTNALHQAGLEVICDVVFNHTAEQGADGPTLSWRGLDDPTTYRGEDGRYRDDTGCGNTVAADRDPVLRTILDCMRWWAGLGVDGFRFDLAATLTRGDDGPRDDAPFLAAVAGDPILSSLKLIAEPWDLGLGGYRAGRFPAPWAEWNDRYRDGVRDYWRGAAGAAEVATRIAGSADRFEPSGRDAAASVNYLTAHDGFTLADLVSYSAKHNEANGEGDTDGRSDNRSHNHGVEGPTDDAEILHRRRLRVRSLLATLLFSHGTPMLQAGDELGRTQRGNNNAYCHDSELTWLDYSTVGTADDHRAWVAALTELRRRYPVLRPVRRLHGDPLPDGRTDLAWYGRHGHRLDTEHWSDPDRRVLGVGLATPKPGGTLHLVFNSGPEAWVTLPPDHGATRYRRILDTSWPTPDGIGEVTPAGGRVSIAGGSVAAFTVD